MIRLVVFDIGKTLYVPHGPSIRKGHEAQLHWLRKKGVSLTLERLDEAFQQANECKQGLKRMAKPHYMTIKQLEHLQLPASWAGPLIRLFYATRIRFEGQKGISPGARQIIRWLHKRKIAMGIISNADLSWARSWVKRHHFPIPPSTILISHEVGVRKPAKKVFDIYFKRMRKRIQSLKRSEILMVGDRDNDFAAKKAGFQTCWYNPQKQKMSYFKFRPDFEISDFRELKAIVLSHARNRI